jgi:hypothetical protein
LVLNENAIAATGRRGHFAVQPNGLFRKPAEELSSVTDLALSIAQRLAVFQCDELCQHLLLLDHQLKAATQDLAPLAWGCPRPKGQSLVCRANGRKRIIDTCVRHL